MGRKFKRKFFAAPRKSFFADESGQAGAVFRLMIDAIIGLVILMMIVSALNYFNSMRILASRNEFFSQVKNAVDSPNGEVFESSTLVFAQGEGYSSYTLQDKTGRGAACFVFKTNISFAKLEESAEPKAIFFNQPIETIVYSKCWPTGDSCGEDDPECCEVKCVISFGAKLQKGIGP